jgi:steroid delta-isomerase-like uncharacterized protein
VSAEGVFDAWERAWSGRDPAAFAEVCTPGVHYEDPLTPVPLTGPTALASHAARLWAAFPDARVNQAGQRLADGRFAVAPVVVLGTHSAPLEGLPASHRPLRVHAVAYAELADERIARIRVFFDLYAVAVQLGVLPRSGSVGERALMLLRGFGLRRP